MQEIDISSCALSTNFLKESEALITQYLYHLKISTKCKFCGGYGHHGRECSTLKKVNRYTRSVPHLKSAWGGMKSAYLKTDIESKTLVAVKRRLAKSQDK